MVDLDIEVVPQLYPQLGRQKVQDPRSTDFAVGAPIDKSLWVTKLIRIYDPLIHPNQCHGECTGCASAMMLNSDGNRNPREILNMNYAHACYSGASANDPWEGSWPPTDTGSSGLAAAKTAQSLRRGGSYRWIMGGADEVVQTIQNGRVVSIGTWWYENMMRKDANLMISPTGRRVGGHQYVARGYDVARDLVVIRCWWGRYRDAYIKRTELHDLLMDGGDAHVQDRVIR